MSEFRPEVLEPGEPAWRQGKIRLRFVIDFCPDEFTEPEKVLIESSLDQIRQMNVE